MSELYNGRISEFVDWIDGRDTSGQTEETTSNIVNSTEGLPASGKAIRELIQRKLKQPFYVFEDVAAGLYRLFSSEEAKNKWTLLTDPESIYYDPDAAKKYELFNFERPGDITMQIKGISSNARYIIKGDAASEDAELKYYVTMQKEEAGGITADVDSFTVTYTILNSDGVEHTIVEEMKDTDITPPDSNARFITKNIYDYLAEGNNSVTIKVKARNSSANNTINFSVYLVNFELSSTFDYATAKVKGGSIEVPVKVTRSVSNLTLTVSVYVDNNPAVIYNSDSVAQWVTNDSDLTVTNTILIANTYAENTNSSEHIKHSLRIEAMMGGNNSNTTFYSNVLFFDFEVASSVIGIKNNFVNIKYSTPYNMVEQDSATSKVILRGTQYEPFALEWAYYTDQTQSDLSIPVQWAIRRGSEGNYTYQVVGTINGNKGTYSDTLRFIPDSPIERADHVYLVARYGDKDLDAYQIIIDKSNLSVNETSDYNLKLTAYGKTNSSTDKAEWKDTNHNVDVTFSDGVLFDNNTGWDNNSLVLSGETATATVNYCPIPTTYDLAKNGKTVEVEFKSENVNDDDDVIMRIGGMTGCHIDITPNAAYVRLGSNTEDVVHTNFKSNETVKLAFIFNPITTSDTDYNSNLVYIINNGILERAASYGNANSYLDDTGRITIGGSKSGIRAYSIRAYDKAISYKQALNNFIYDSDNKATLISNNDIFDGNKISYDACKGKIDTILISGNLDNILASGTGKEGSESTVTIERICVTDATKNFKVENGKIRKHGQSTLNYPITSMKFWTNKASSSEVTPKLTLSDNQAALGLNKNRYIMKTGAIPSNKFVLQANYADSSGVHNGGLERLIQDTWYNAEIDGEFKLRTAPQLFTSGRKVNHNNANIGETEDAVWVEGEGTDKAAGMTWNDVVNKPFPYTVRIAPDSFPCAVFYNNSGRNGDGKTHYLGQYVFMDDKKSDFLYGERSIYSFGDNTDPFVLRIENTKNGPKGKQDIKENRVWNNKNVLRVEVVLLNNTLSSYMDFNVPASYSIDENGDIIEGSAGRVPCTSVKYDEKGNPTKFYWEDYFEIIYPDPDDIAEDDADNGLTKFSEGSDFQKKAKPFIDFLEWITSIGQLNKVNGVAKVDGTVVPAALNKFKAEAHEHLDLYKLAAYYIFCLRFGLVDSVERNAQLKTYDGKHWHYEPWDMDIALGNKNDGGLVYNPPVDRDTRLPGDATTFAFSGRSMTTSNVLWDCLEAWDYWTDTIVPAVAQALYKAGLTYDNVIAMFDGEYSDKWSESMYNESGFFKYIQSGGEDWLAWLQGSRASHRHWWISTSMNYYDAKWSCGSFNDHRVYLGIDKDAHSAGTDIVVVKPTSSTFFKFTKNDGTASLGTLPASKTAPAEFDVSAETFSVKDPTHIYGATFIEELDISCFAKKISALDVSLAYDSVLGAPIKVLNVGIPYTKVSDTEYSGSISGTKLRLTGYSSTTESDALANLQVLNINGQGAMLSVDSILSTNNRKNVTELYAIGTKITQFENAPSGNRFTKLYLPGKTTTNHAAGGSDVSSWLSFKMTNASWDDIQFWDAVTSDAVVYDRDADGNIITDDDGNPVIEANSTTFTKSRVPAELRTVGFYGSTASNRCAGQFLLDWIKSIELDLAAKKAGYTEEDLYEVLSGKIFKAENIRWGNTDTTGNINISYKDILRIAHLNNGNNTIGNIKGYIVLSDNEPLTSSQLTTLRKWFGASVFDKSAIYSGLVIDQNTDYVEISASGDVTIDEETDEIYLEEKHNAELVATKFILGEDATEYVWSVSTDAESGFKNEYGEPTTYANSVHLEEGDDGIMRLIADEGDFGDYPVYVRAEYVNNYNQSVYKTIKINIIGVTYPADFQIITTGSPRRLELSEAIAKNIFGLSYYQYNNQIVPTYVLYQKNQKVDFYINVIDNGQPYTATLKSIEYRYLSIDKPSNSMAFVNEKILNDGDTTVTSIGDDEQLGYSGESTNRGITLSVLKTTDDMALYGLTTRIYIGGKDAIFKHINLIVIDDNQPLLRASTANQLFMAISTKYANDFGLTSAFFDFYKSHLMSVYGTLDLTDYKTISGFGTNLGDSIFKYLINISGLIIDGNTNNLMTDTTLKDGTTNPFDFSHVINLESIVIKNCTNFAGVLSVPNTSVKSIDLTGTILGLEVGELSNLTELKLGNPTKLSISKALALTDVSVQGSDNLESVDLKTVNVTEGRAYNIFDELTTPVA